MYDLTGDSGPVQAVLDAAAEYISVLGLDGVVVMTNEDRPETRSDDLPPHFPSAPVGSSFVEACRRLALYSSGGALDFPDRVEAVLSGTSDCCEFEYRSRQLSQETETRVRVTPIAVGGMLVGAVVRITACVDGAWAGRSSKRECTQRTRMARVDRLAAEESFKAASDILQELTYLKGTFEMAGMGIAVASESDTFAESLGKVIVFVQDLARHAAGRCAAPV